jgi:hypothetical protein
VVCVRVCVSVKKNSGRLPKSSLNLIENELFGRLSRTCSLEKNFIHNRENETVIEQLLIIMDRVPALVWHTSDPYQDSGEPSTSEPCRWRGKTGAKQYQISGIPLS